ncbi:MAG TPA: hypothetical protein VKP00_06765, partial [Gemmatimonadaceae bacterium]|nr:hypothetical protein [Gemmatimonadaceae bacterium]
MSIRSFSVLGATLVGVSALHAQSRALASASPGAAHPAAMMSAVDTSLLHGLHFRMVGPPRGGRVTTVAGVASQPRT